MRFKPMTYLVSFTLFVMLFMGLGGYVAYLKFTEHFLVQGYLDAVSIDAHVQSDKEGKLLNWQGRLSQPEGIVVSITGSNRPAPIRIRYSDEPAAQAASPARDIPLAANERTQDIRIDRSGQWLYARVFATSDLKSRETTWLIKYDLRRRAILRRASVNPILLPAPFRP